MLKALVFDFDGLILDTETPEFLAWSDIYQRHGVSLDPAAWGVGVGTWDAFDPVTHLEGLTGRPVTAEELRREQRERCLALIAAEQPLPGVRELLDGARERGLKLAVASSSGREWVEGHLRALGLLDRFQCVRTRDDVARVKPDPELYLAAAACLGVEPGECVAFEDSPNGARAALAAGMRLAVIPNGITRDLAFPEGGERFASLLECRLDELLA